jgi:hypothetical protein
MSAAVIEEFASKVGTLEGEVEQKWREAARKPVDLEDAAEEAIQFAADEASNHDTVEDVMFDPFDGDKEVTSPTSNW